MDGQETPLSRRKIPNDESSCTSAMANFFVRNFFMLLIILIRYIMRITWWWLWHTSIHLCLRWKGGHSSGWSLTLIRPFDLSIGFNWKVALSPRNWRRQKQMFINCLMVCVVLSFPMTFGCPRRHRIFFQWQHITHVTISGSMITLGFPSQHQLLAIVFKLRLVM